MSQFKDDLLAFIRHLVDNEADRILTLKAKARQVDSLVCEVEMKKYLSVLDANDILLKPTIGPNPLSLLLASLAASQEMTFGIYSQMLDIDLKELEIHVEGDFDIYHWLATEPIERVEALPEFREIRVTVFIETDSPKPKVDLLITYTQKYCPVLKLIKDRVSLRYIVR